MVDAAAGVESGRRFVQEKEPRRADETRPEVELAAHAARVGAHQPVRGLGQSHLLEHPRAVRARRAAILAEETRDHLQVLAPGHRRLDGGELPGEADHLPHEFRLTHDVVAEDAEAPGVGLD